jgi:TPR repeat protein
MSQNKKYNEYNEVNDSNKKLNKEEIDQLKEVFKNKCYSSFINTYSRKNYDLFINNKIFEPDDNDTYYIDDLYYLGTYYQFIFVNYNLMKKYYLRAVEKGNANAMNNLGHYYRYEETNYDLMKKYYLQAINKGNTRAMYSLGCYYKHVEKNYDLMKKYYLQAVEKGNTNAMNNLGHYYDNVRNYDLSKKYYLQATEKGNSDAMINLGYYYEYNEKNYDLMKKYYLQAIEKGNYGAIFHLDTYYMNNMPNNRDLQNYFDYIIRGNIPINYSKIFDKDKYIERNEIINLFCLNIDNNNLKFEDFKFCLVKIVNYINHCELRKSCELKNIKHFARYINKLRYHSKNKSEYKKCTNETFKNEASQIFIEYLDLYYYEYLKKIFAPGGKGYIKTKNHFELTAKLQKNNN